MINVIAKWETLANVQLNTMLYTTDSFETLRKAKEQCLLNINCAGIASSSTKEKFNPFFATVLYPAVMYEDQNPITFRSKKISGKV